MAALGRPFTLGMLYDSRTDVLVPGATLWDQTTLQKNTEESCQHSSEFHITSSDSIESKSTLLDVNASLKASFMGGLIEVGGSAKYLNDLKKSHNQSRVMFQYKATTTFKQLLMTELRTRGTQQIEKGLATHVVTGILYGANAFFVFDSEKVDASSVQDIQGSMEAVIKKIPSFNIEGKVDIKLTDEEKALTNKFSCKFYGDFILESNPTTFEDAVRAYQQLPMLLGENEKNVVPLKVWMMSLKNFDSGAAEVVNEVSVGLVMKAQDALEDFRKVEMRCNDCLADTAVNTFLPIHEKLSRFKTMCQYYRAAMQEDIAKKIPLIREGKEDDSSLMKLFEDRDKSLFSHGNLIKWMDHMEREIVVISSCLEIMEGIKTVRNQSELDREILAPGVDEVLCLVFTSLETTDPYLQELVHYRDSLKLQSNVDVSPTIQNPWFFSDEVISKIQEKAQTLDHLAKAQKNNSSMTFLVAAIANEKYKGASVYHYRNTILVSDDVSKPEVTDVKKLTDRKDLMWYACDLSLDPDTANFHLILSEGNKKATHGERQQYPDLPQRFDGFHQVLCREQLTGCCYWEVEWSTGHSEDVAVGVSYGGLYRKGKGDWSRLGRNVMSWCLGHRWNQPVPTLYAEHDKQCTYFPLPDTGCSRLGVYLDWSAGTLSYYKVSANTVTHLHTFHTHFTEPVYPAFMIWRHNNYVFLPL